MVISVGWKPAALAAAAMLAAFPGAALAQAVAGGSGAEDPYSVVDQNGVNLITGKPSLSTRDLTIGDVGAGPRATCWSDGGWNDRRGDGGACSISSGFRELRSNLEDMNSSGLELTRYWNQSASWQGGNLIGGWQTNWSSNLSLDRGRFTATFGNQSFNFSSVTYQSPRGDGSTITPLGNNSYRVTTREGTEILFPSVPSHYYASPTLGPATKITYPNGREINISYATRAGCGNPYCADFTYLRVQQVSSSDNYGLLFEYPTDNGTADNLSEWIQPSRVTAFNRSIDNCPTTQMHCSFSRAWPAVNYTNTATAMTSTSPAGRTTTYLLSGGKITRIIDPDGNVAQDFTYYPQSNIYLQNMVSSVTRAGGTWLYSPSNPPTNPSSVVTMTVTDPLNGVTVTKGTTRWGISEIKDPLNRTTTFTYDTQGRLLTVTRPSGAYSTRTYDARGNITEMRQVATPGSGTPDLVNSASFPASCTNMRTCNKATSVTNARGFVTDYTYDANHGGVLTVTRPAGQNGVRPQARFTYSLIGGIYRLSESSSCRTLAVCTGTSDETKTIFGHGTANILPTSITTTSGTGSPTATFSSTYDDIGNVVSSTDPLGTTEYLFHDADRRVTGMISGDPDGGGPLPRRAVRYTYNGTGQPTAIERGSVTGTTAGDLAAMAAVQSLVTTYDGQGRKIREADQAGGVAYTTVQYSYDILGRSNCSAIRMNPAAFASLPASACAHGPAGADGPDRISRTHYDAASRVIRIEEAYGTADQADEQSTTYTLNGQTETVTDAENNRTTYEYDGQDRLVKIRYPISTRGALTSSSTDFEQMTLDPHGNVTQRRLRDGQLINYTYDGLDRLVLKDLPAPEADVSYVHDLNDRPLSTSQGSATVTIGYDGLGRHVSETTALGTMSFQYDAAGRLTRTTWPDGLFVTRDYLATGELTALRENGAGSGPGVLATYGYDALGRLTGVTHGNGTSSSFGYDAVSRRNSVAHDLAGTAHDVAISLTHNAADQIRDSTRNNDAYAWTAHYGVARPYSVNGLNQLTAAGPVPLSYLDQRGNLTHSGSSVYAYTAENRLISGPGVTLSYDPAGRLSQTAGAATTRFQYDGADLLAEYSSAGGLLRRYVHGASTDDPVVWYEGAGTTDRRWLHSDERGSIIGVSNSAGTMIALNAYDEFGIRQPTNIGRFQYTGQTWLPELGLYYYKARMYSPTLGRFMQTDPLGYADGINWYNYVGGDPVNLTDPDGQEAPCVTLNRPCLRQGADPFGSLYRLIFGDIERAVRNPNARNIGIALVTITPVGKTFRWAQTSYRAVFSPFGRNMYSRAAGYPIETVGDLARALRARHIRPDQVPLEAVRRGNVVIILNTRSRMALESAGIPRSRWRIIDKTNDAETQRRLNDQLRRNGLGPNGTAQQPTCTTTTCK